MSQLLPEQVLAEAIGDVDVPGSLQAFAEAISERHRSALRLRRFIDPNDLPVPVEPVPWYSLGYRATSEATRASQLWHFALGDIYLQDAGSLLALAVAGADTNRLSGQLICDLCAAPGGKASAMLEAISDLESAPGGFVLANEVIRSRIGALQWNLARTGSDRYAISNLDPDDLASKLPGTFDIVLVDAPCSGQALIGKGKQKVASLSQKQILHSAARQERILDAAVRLLRPGGKLVYSTCTFAFLENEAQIRRLIESGDSHPVDFDQLKAYRSEPGCYRIWPHLHGSAGSFASAVVVDGRADATAPSTTTGGRRRSPKHPKVVAGWKSHVDEFYQLDPSVRLHPLESSVIGWPADAPAWVEQIAMTGPELIHRTGQTWKPSHIGAFRQLPSPLQHNSVADPTVAAMIEVDASQAHTYMRGEPIASTIRGWQVVRFRGRSLGWAKGNGSIAKNHLPAAARVQNSFIG